VLVLLSVKGVVCWLGCPCVMYGHASFITVFLHPCQFVVRRLALKARVTTGRCCQLRTQWDVDACCVAVGRFLFVPLKVFWWLTSLLLHRFLHLFSGPSVV